MVESNVLPAATSGVLPATSSGVLPAATAGGKTASCTTMGYLALHPVGTAVVGAILIGVGAYYLGKHFANRASKKEPKEAVAPVAVTA